MSTRTGEEIEIKERLSSHGDWAKVKAALGGSPNHTENQENFFFDGSGGQLAAKRSSVRFRFINGDKCLVTVKEGSVLTSGVNVAKETEEFVDFHQAKQAISGADLSAIFSISRVAADALRRYGVSEKDLRCIGSLKTVREAFDFESHVLELDSTDFGFGLSWEIEIETTKEIAPSLREKLCKFLDGLSASHKPSKKTKLACLVTRSIE